MRFISNLLTATIVIIIVAVSWIIIPILAGLLTVVASFAFVYLLVEIIRQDVERTKKLDKDKWN